MIRISLSMGLFIGASALLIAPLASANPYSYNSHNGGYHSQNAPISVNCERQKDGDRLMGSLIGAVAGGALGVAIADNNDNNYRGHGYRGYRGYRGHRSYRGHRGGNGNEVAGAVIGGVLGAVVGGEIAANTGRDCQTQRTSFQGNTTYRTYGAMDVAPPTRSATGPAWEEPVTRVYSTTTMQPVTSTRTVTYGDDGYGDDYSNDNLYGGPTTTTRTYPAQPVQTQRACRTVQRETRLPDNTVMREPVQVCQASDGNWTFTQNGAAY